MKTNRFTVETLIYGLAFGLALFLRAAALGVAPLADSEAELGLRALAVANGGRVPIGSDPGYVLSTGLVFFLFGSSTALARLVPVLTGSILTLSPYFFRRWLGRLPAIFLAFGLALDPGLVALSRQASGIMLAVAFSVFAVAFWTGRRPILGGVFAGLALLSGPAFYPGLVGGLLALVMGRSIGIRVIPDRGGQSAAAESAGQFPPGWQTGLLSGGGTVLLAGTLFLRFPQGIGGMAAALPAYLESWFTPSGVPAGRLLFALLAYHPWVVVLGLVGFVAAWLRGDRTGRWLSLWLLAALGLSLLPLGRQVQDLVWPLLPLWALAATVFAGQLIWPGEDGLTALGLAALIFIFLLYSGINLAAIARMPLDPQAIRIRWQLIGGALGLVVVSSVLIRLGWSGLVARLGVLLGGSLVLGLFTLAATWWVLDRSGNRVQELWYSQPSTVQEDLLLQTIGDLSEWSTGRRDGVEIVEGTDLPSLRWALRAYPEIYGEDRLDGVYYPPLVITQQFDEPRLNDTYRGTDFVWRESPAWGGATPENALQWLYFREGPTQPDKIVLWARNDLFPDGSLLNLEAGRVSE